MKLTIFKKSIQMLFAFIFCMISAHLAANETPDQKNIARYLELNEKYPHAFGPNGDWKKGEIELVLDLPTMMKIQTQFHQPVGVVAEDRFWIWIRDAIILPTGEYNTYNRFISQKGLNGPAGVVVLAVNPNNDILVNLIYRHATRNWEIELPRGGRDKGETTLAAAKREVKEETGYIITDIFPLGTITTDSGIFTNFLEVFFAKIDKLENTSRDDEEVIATVITLSKNKVLDIFCDGKLEIVVNGQKITAYCRDSFFAYALLLAEKKGLL
ncbi:MAG: NUDIX hydrolase [Chlamydiae bacterium]|nr:NUDIX hydrolase [Chlamydiota bacterium]